MSGMSRELLERILKFAQENYPVQMNGLIAEINIELAKPETKPVGIITDCKHNGLEAQLTTDTWNNNEGLKAGMLLYTHPPVQQKPLSDDEITKCYESSGHYQTLRPQDKRVVFEFARAIEQAHGIK